MNPIIDQEIPNLRKMKILINMMENEFILFFDLY